MINSGPSSVEDDDGGDKDATSIDSGNCLGSPTVDGRESGVSGVRDSPAPLRLPSPSTARGPDCHTRSRPREGGGPPRHGSDIGAVTDLTE